MKWRGKTGSSKEELQVLRREALEVIQSWGISSSVLLFEFDVIICELLANAAEHGNCWQVDKKVSLRMRFRPKDNRVFIMVWDEGQKTIGKLRPSDDLLERGRGLMLIESFTNGCRTGPGKVWIRKEVVHGEADSSG